jgi:hypothetical protein
MWLALAAAATDPVTDLTGRDLKVFIPHSLADIADVSVTLLVHAPGLLATAKERLEALATGKQPDKLARQITRKMGRPPTWLWAVGAGERTAQGSGCPGFEAPWDAPPVRWDACVVVYWPGRDDGSHDKPTRAWRTTFELDDHGVPSAAQLTRAIGDALRSGPTPGRGALLQLGEAGRADCKRHADCAGLASAMGMRGLAQAEGRVYCRRWEDGGDRCDTCDSCWAASDGPADGGCPVACVVQQPRGGGRAREGWTVEEAAERFHASDPMARAALQEAHPRATRGELANALHERWVAMDEEGRKPYVETAAQARAAVRGRAGAAAVQHPRASDPLRPERQRQLDTADTASADGHEKPAEGARGWVFGAANIAVACVLALAWLLRSWFRPRRVRRAV